MLQNNTAQTNYTRSLQIRQSREGTEIRFTEPDLQFLLYYIHFSGNQVSSLISHMQSPQITFTARVARTIVPHSGQTYRRDPLFALPALLTGLPLPVPITGTTISRSFRHSCIS